jgi:hypothetical protein
MKDGAQRFLLLHHPMNDHRPVFSGKTVFGVFWLWSPFASNRRRANVICSVVSEQVLHLEIQGASRSKQEGENWRQRTRNPSVPVSLFIECEIHNRTCKERSEERRVAPLHTAVSRLRLAETCSMPAHTLFPCRAPRSPRPGALAHGTTASFPLDIPSPFLLGRSLLKVPCSQRMDQGASTRARLVQAWGSERT